MLERGGGAGLPLKALERLRIPGELFRKELERNVAAELQVLGFVHHAHAAAAHFREDAVVRDGLANHRGIEIGFYPL